MSYTNKTFNFDSIKSKFRKLENTQNINTELNNDQLIEITRYKVNTMVTHPIFGKGIIKSIEGKGPDSRAKILFNEKGEKNLLLKYAKLKILKT